MGSDNGQSVRVRGDVLRRIRKRSFRSAEAFSAACGSVSLPTVYRAERGGPILLSYLSRIARELDVDVEQLRVSAAESSANLTGRWMGLVLVTDKFGHPSVILEDIHMEQNGTKVFGRTVQKVNGDTMVDVFRDCSFQDNVLCGQSRSETWTFPLETAFFILSGSRDMTWLDGYVTWLDIDSQIPQSSKYIMVRHGTDGFEMHVKHAHRIMDDEAKLLRTRRLLENGYSFSTSLALVAAVQEDAEPASQEPSHKMVEATPAKVAVIAMAQWNMSPGTQSQAHWASGLLDEIATDLARVPGIRTVPRSAFGQNASISCKHAGALGATHLLKGDLDSTHDRIRAVLQLVHLESGQVVWAEQYDHAAEVSFTLHDSIARDLTRTVLDGPKPISEPSKDTSNAVAYELFVKARLLYLRGMYAPTLRAAEALLVRAIDLEPDFARAYAQLSICRSYLAQSIERSQGAQTAQEGFEDAERALELDPELPLGQAALGLALYATGDYAGAAIWLERAIDMDETLFEAHFFQGRNKRLQGDRAGAVESFAKAAQIRPDDFRAFGLLAEEMLALGQRREARDAQETAMHLIEAELEVNPDNAGAMAFGAGLLADLNRFEQGAAWAEWAVAIAPTDCLVQYNVARFHALRNAGTRPVLDHLEAAFSVPEVVQSRLANWLKLDQAFDGVRNARRYQRLLDQTNSHIART
ncbi:hypothetical protein So717_01300 [Roseobacter cerasinus]|uniref:Uncharacterized protein n=1 Tax=Roseobacter cerasinus TaxID=2602289 RepID=A0A640VKV2_9RHOB|nr:hypothetical protein [Roseobacter cerasinus]GFE48377.1 hypothetical protein So717_01300 [Roseobacter cerasinus]